MKKRKIAIIVLLISLLAGGSAWAWMHIASKDRLQKVKDLGAKMMAGGKRPSHEDMEEMEKARKDLTPAEDEQLKEEGRRVFEERERKFYADYMAMTPDQRKVFIKKQVDDQLKDEDRRKKWREEHKDQASGASATGSGGSGSGGPGGGRHGGTPQTSDQILKRQKQRLDHTTPEQRAQRDVYVADINKRRGELSLPPLTGVRNGGYGVGPGFGGRHGRGGT